MALTLAGASSAAAVAPKPGGHYHGSSVLSIPTSIVVSKDGTRLSEYLLTTRISCSNGKKQKVFLDQRREPTAKISGTGSFASTTPSQAGRITLGRKRVKGRFKSTFSGQFDTQTSARGSITTRFKTGKTRCKGTRPFTVFLDGTSGSPYRNARAATGSYSARGAGLRFGTVKVNGVRRAGFRVDAPGQLLTGLRVQATARCRRGGRLGVGFDYVPLYLHRGRVNLSERARFRLRKHQVDRERYRLKVRLYKSGATYRLSGSFTDTARIYQRGKRIATCRVPTRRFSGAFMAGPANLF